MRAQTREGWQEATFRANGLAVSQETRGTLCLEGGWTDLEGLCPHSPGAGDRKWRALFLMSQWSKVTIPGT